jgi:hypothetical protein
MIAVGVNLVIGVEPAFGGKPRLAVAARLELGPSAAAIWPSDIEGPPRPATYHLAMNNVERLDRRLHQL